MEKPKTLLRNIFSSRKLIVVSLLFVLSLMIIFYTFISSKTSKNSPLSNIISPTPTPTAYLGIISQSEPFPTPSLTINWSSQSVDIPSSMDIYSVSQPLINPKNADILVQKLGLNSSTEQPTIDQNFRSWSSGNSSLSLNFQDNELIFSAGGNPQTVGQVHTEDEYFLAAKNYLLNLFGSTFSDSLIRQGLTYHKVQGFDTVPTTVGDSTLVRITFYQSLNKFPLATTSETGTPITIFLDKNMGLNTLKIKDAYVGIVSLGHFSTLSLSATLKDANTTALRINASPYYDIAVDTAAAKNINFNQSSVQVAYYSYNHQYVPVYLLEGTVKTSNTTDQPGLYILPATSQQ